MMLTAAILDAMRAELTRTPATTWPTPATIAHTIDPRTINTDALNLIDQALIDLTNTPDGRLIVSMPPQEGKSTRCSRDLPIWALARNRDLRIVTASYAQGLANRNGRAVRNAITAHPELGMTIAHDNGAASEWTLTGHEGGVLSVGRGAGVTGRPADMLIIDDPLKDRTEADSLTIRDTCWDWWTDALSARLAPGAPVLLVLTRWHEDDLAGRLTSLDTQAGWRVINIPAQCENPDTDPLGRQAGEYMVSARGRTPSQWEARKATAGARTWAALYQGHPSPAQGDIFHRDWWRYWTRMPSLSGRIIQSWDLTFKPGTNSDWVVGQVWMRQGADHYLLDQVRGRWSFTETRDQICNLTAKWPQVVAKYIEDKANGPAIIDELHHQVPGIVPVTPHGSKNERAAAITPLLEAGNVHIPAPNLAPWVDGLVEEAAAFPQGTHDDQVDALTQALSRLSAAPGLRRFHVG